MKKIYSVIVYFFVFCLLAWSNASADISSDLSLYIPFNGDVLDGSGNANVVNNTTAVFVDDRNGADESAVQFNSNGYGMSVEDSSYVNMGISDFSVSFWCKWNETNDLLSLDKRTSTPAWSGYFVQVTSGKLYVSLAGRWFYAAQNKYLYGQTTYGSGLEIVSPGDWHFVTVTVDRDSTTGMKFYVDSILEETYDPTKHVESIDSIVDLRVYAAVNSLGDSLDDVRLYKRVLTSSDVVELYASTNPDPIYYVASEGINDLSIDTGTDPEIAMLSRNSGGTFIKIADTVTGNVIKTITGFFSSSTDWMPVAITSVNVSGGQAIVVSARNESTDQMKSETYNLVTDSFETNVVTLPLYGN